MYLHGTAGINEKGHLQIGGCDTTQLVKTYGTPLYVVDEALVRRQCAEYMEAFRASGLPFQVAYASKAFCVMAMCSLAAEEGLSLDVVSDGELYTALKAGFPPERIHFHGNNKTPEEIEMAIDAGIGCFVIDNFLEMQLVNQIGAEKGVKVKALFRVTPGVEAHTHEYISTGQQDSKFGFDITNGSAARALSAAKQLENIEILGVHSHIGSQIFEVEGFHMAVERVAAFAQSIRAELDITFTVVNLGGGFGIRYVDGHTPLPISQYVKAITDAVKQYFSANAYPLPQIWVEPGRSIVGEAGTTLYTVGSVKEIPGVRKYVAVDGGMTDNPRPALYQSKYEAMLANRANDDATEVVSIAGKCCESGDMLIWDLSLPKVEFGDLLAVSCTGAYNYAMASNYNRIRRPAVVFVRDGEADLVVKRETLDDLLVNDLIPRRIKNMKKAKIILKNGKEVIIDLLPEEAPNTVANFEKLANDGFYDDLKFHRVIPGFVAQAGCPFGVGYGDAGYKIKCETDTNVSKHVRGTLSMAHAGKDTGSSQFFICFEPQPHLDKKHTIFGIVSEGMDAVDEIKQGDKMAKIVVWDE